MRFSLMAGFAAAILSTGALASATDDGNAGLEAYQRGSYDEAITLFTRAIKSGQLSNSDKEFAYLNRGRSYLAKNQYKSAISDLTIAVRLNPGDSDASDALTMAKQAAALGKSSGGGAQAGTGWGMLAAMAGHYYWYQFPDKDPHTLVIHYEWAVPQQLLTYTLRTKSDVVAAGEYKLDTATNKLLEAEATSNTVMYATASASPQSLTEYYYLNGPSHVTTVRQADGSMNTTSQVYLNGAWQDQHQIILVEVPEADLIAQGFEFSAQ